MQKMLVSFAVTNTQAMRPIDIGYGAKHMVNAVRLNVIAIIVLVQQGHRPVDSRCTCQKVAQCPLSCSKSDWFHPTHPQPLDFGPEALFGLHFLLGLPRRMSALMPCSRWWLQASVLKSKWKYVYLAFHFLFSLRLAEMLKSLTYSSSPGPQLWRSNPKTAEACSFSG